MNRRLLLFAAGGLLLWWWWQRSGGGKTPEQLVVEAYGRRGVTPAPATVTVWADQLKAGLPLSTFEAELVKHYGR